MPKNILSWFFLFPLSLTFVCGMDSQLHSTKRLFLNIKQRDKFCA